MAALTDNVQLANKLSAVNYKNLKFIIMDRPTSFNLASYLKELKKAVSYALSNLGLDCCLPVLLRWRARCCRCPTHLVLGPPGSHFHRASLRTYLRPR